MNEEIKESKIEKDTVVETVTITMSEYLNLLDRDYMLTCLENGGVDNWDFYENALEEYWENSK